MEILARFKAVTEGELMPFSPQKITRLGAPFGADWSEYPVSDKPMILFLGGMARLIGVIQTSNFALMLAHISAALAFYGCARFLRCQRIWSFAGALLFAFTYQITSRGLPHLWLTFAYTVPCAVLVCWLVSSSRRVGIRNATTWFCLGTSVVLGVSNPYNLFFFLQLLTLALLVQLLGDRRAGNLWLGFGCLFVAFAAFFSLQIDNWVYPVDEGAAPLMTRNYGGTERYALKPIELFLTPSTHHLKLFADVGYRYLRWSDIKGETFTPYLGIIGWLGVLWIFAELLRKLMVKGEGRLQGYGLQIGWILFYSGVGGLNSALSLYFGLHIFRATNRFSIFISAIVLLFLVSRISRLTANWSKTSRLLLAVGLVLFGLYDQLPRPIPATELAEMAARAKSDEAFGRSLESNLPRRAMLFQLPLLDFPEGRPLRHFADYEHFRPYLVTKTLRFTYATLKGRSPARWQRDYEQLEPSRLVAALEEAGFAGLFINRRAYDDQGEELLKAIGSAGCTELIEDSAHELVVVRLHPVPKPRPPLAYSVTFGEGWNSRESGDDEKIRWARGPAALSYYNPFSKPIGAYLRFQVVGVGQRHFDLSLNGHSLLAKSIDDDPSEVKFAKVELKPGVNRFDLSTQEDAVRISQERSRLRAFAIDNFEFKVLPDSLPPP